MKEEQEQSKNQRLKQDYTDLTPETILAAVESLGYETSGRQLALTVMKTAYTAVSWNRVVPSLLNSIARTDGVIRPLLKSISSRWNYWNLKYPWWRQ